ncbi:MAG: hypothetical protein EA403_01330 [Spirochaetaceae bacterium]|nr:MAG: hypothetical protein EA403_01330 [Spirochaetaceae bacterium]
MRYTPNSYQTHRSYDRTISASLRIMQAHSVPDIRENSLREFGVPLHLRGVWFDQLIGVAGLNGERGEVSQVKLGVKRLV